LKEIPPEKPRLINSNGDPVSIMNCISKGIDLITTAFPSIVAVEGSALVFPLTMDFEGPQSVTLQMKTRAFLTENSPILRSCSCYTCKNHSRAYIYHLLNTHELLASVLLELHNLHHYLQFFSYLRTLLKDNTFDAYKLKFTQLVN